MTRETQKYLSEKHIYFSLTTMAATLILVSGMFIMVGRSMAAIESIPTLIDEVKQMQIHGAGFESDIKARVSGLEGNLRYIEKFYQIDFPNN